MFFTCSLNDDDSDNNLSKQLKMYKQTTEPGFPLKWNQFKISATFQRVELCPSRKWNYSKLIWDCFLCVCALHVNVVSNQTCSTHTHTETLKHTTPKVVQREREREAERAGKRERERREGPWLSGDVWARWSLEGGHGRYADLSLALVQILPALALLLSLHKTQYQILYERWWEGEVGQGKK